MYKFLRHKIIQFLALICLLTNSFTPFIYALPQPTPAYAQEVSPTDTPTESNVTPTVTNVPSGDITPTTAESTPTVTTTSPSVAPVVPETGNEDVNVVVLNDTKASTVDTAAYETVGSASLTTDKPDYAPTDTALITGSGLVPGASYTLNITSSDAPAVNFVTQLTASGDGQFAYAYQLDGNYRPNYQVKLTDGDGTVVATTTFTDASGPATDISQCQNGGIGDPLQPCSETAPNAAASGYGYEGNANANGSNSHWREGDFVPIRIVATNYSAGAGNIQFSIDVTKGGKHAYDYIGSFDATETTGAPTTNHANHNNPCGDIANLPVTSDCTDPVTPDSTGSIPAATLSPFPTVCGSNTFVGSQIAGSVSAWGTSGPLTVTYVSQNVGSSDCVTTIQVAWSNTKAGFNGTLVIAYAPHIAKQTDWGSGNSAITISGSPYHSSLVQYTTGGDTKGIGQQDAKLAASAIVQKGSITIVKDADPNDTQDFHFTTTGTGLSAFDLDDDGDNGNTLSNTKLFSNLDAGTYSVAEGAVSGWTQTSAVCDDGSPVSAISLQAGENVTCTFTNTRQTGKIELQKDFVGTPESVTIKIGTTQNGSEVDSDVLSADGTDGEHTVTTGGYFVSETLTTSANYTTALECFNDVDHNNTIGGSDTSHTVNASTGAVSVGNNDDVICRFTNTRNQGTVELRKVWSGTGGQTTLNIGTTAGDDDVDTQPTGANGGAPLTTGQTPVNTGTYFMSESGVLTNYNTAALSCFNDANNNGTNDGESSVSVGSNDSVSVTTGQHVICTYTNTRKTGVIELQKDFVGGAENVTIKIGTSQNGSQVDSDVLSADGTDGEHPVDTGNYFVSEVLTTPLAYTATLACYNDLDDSNTVNLGDTAHTVSGTGEVAIAENDDVICVFTNTKKGTIIVEKQTLPDGDSTEFTFTGDVAGSASDGGQIVHNNVEPGTYSSTETVPTHWDLTDITCDDSDSTGDEGTATATFEVQAGETVKCTFTNTKRGHIIVDKVTQPSGDPQSFSFDASGSGYVDFNLTDQADPNNQEVVPGAYSVSEGAVTGWDSDGGVCDKGETPASLDVGPGETVTCTFTNTKRATLTIMKDAQPNDCQNFTFAMTGQSNFLLDDDSGVVECVDSNEQASKVFNNLVPGSVTVTETLPNAFWQLSGVQCTGNAIDEVAVANGVQVTLGAGENVTCTFTNNKLGPTRTLGFWKTHTQFTTFVFNTLLGGSVTLGAGTSQEPINSPAKLFGAWYSSISMISTGKGKIFQRTAVDQARMQLAWQWLAAELNCAAFGCSSSIQTLLANASTAYAAGDITLMHLYASLLDTYNNSGDTIIIAPYVSGKATPKVSEALADLVFWDNP